MSATNTRYINSITHTTYAITLYIYDMLSKGRQTTRRIKDRASFSTQVVDSTGRTSWTARLTL